MCANGSGEVDVAHLILVDTDILIDVGRKGTEAVDYLEHMEQQATLGAGKCGSPLPELSYASYKE
jgi:hypothetical protein